MDREAADSVDRRELERRIAEGDRWRAQPARQKLLRAAVLLALGGLLLVGAGLALRRTGHLSGIAMVGLGAFAVVWLGFVYTATVLPVRLVRLTSTWFRTHSDDELPRNRFTILP